MKLQKLPKKCFDYESKHCGLSIEVEYELKQGESSENFAFVKMDEICIQFQKYISSCCQKFAKKCVGKNNKGCLTVKGCSKESEKSNYHRHFLDPRQ